MDPQARKEVQDIAEIQVRRYFDHYLQNVWPQQEKALRDYTDQRVKKHDMCKEAHGRVERRMDRAKWMLAGWATVFAAVGSIAVYGISRMFF